MSDGSIVMPLLLNIILLSIPEETFFTVFSLMVMKRFDLLVPKKANILRLAFIIVFAAVSSNILRLFSIMDSSTGLFCGILIIFVSIVLLFGIKAPKAVFRAFLSVSAAFLVVLAMELLLYPVFSSIPGFSTEEANKPGWVAIVLSLPERMMQLILIVMVFLKRPGFMKLGFFKVITRNKPLGYITGGLVIFNLIFLYIMFRLIYLNNILADSDQVMKVLSVVLVIIFPLMNMSVLLGVINYSVNKYTFTRVYVQEEAKVLRILVHMLLQQQRYGEVDLQMESFVEEIKKIN